MKIRAGNPYPLGATWDGLGVNFALFSEHAAQVELCLFDGADSDIRGTFEALASAPAIEHLRSLWVTAVELMPVHHFLTERHLVQKGLTNYWGFTRMVLRLRREHPVLHGRKFFLGRPIPGTDVKDISWLDPKGLEMSDEKWHEASVRALGVRLVRGGGNEQEELEEASKGKTLVVLLNADAECVPFKLPGLAPGSFWERLLDTAVNEPIEARYEGGNPYPLKSRSVAVFRLEESAS